MKRMHIHLGVEQLEPSIQFYSALFGAAPAKRRDDYAKWMLEDPRVNFAISTRAHAGVDHLGVQVESPSELSQLRERVQSADLAMHDEGEAICCYARADKSWVTDPNGIAWEAFHTMDEAAVFADVPPPNHASMQSQTMAPATCCSSERSQDAAAD